jgi:putative ABC transport system permease protein
MTFLGPAWTALLRMGRRQVRRNRLRSALIVALIAVPVAVVVLADVLWRSDPLTKQQKANEQLGGADALLQFTGFKVLQSPDGTNYGGSSDTAIRAPSLDGLHQLLPGAVAISPVVSRTVVFTTPDGAISGAVSGRDWSDPRVRPAVTLVNGRFATGPGEIALSDYLARVIAVSVGDQVQLKRPQMSFTVVGITHDRFEAKSVHTDVSPAGFAPLATKEDATPSSWFASIPGGLAWPDVLRLNDQGFMVVSQAVLLNPPPRSAVPFYQKWGAQAPSTKSVATGIAVGVAMALLQLALLAGRRSPSAPAAAAMTWR